MTYLYDQFGEVLSMINLDPDVLAASRDRLRLARESAELHPEGRKSFSSGSIQTHTHIQPHANAVSDGDGGIILDRVKHPSLGPDGDGETPQEITDALVSFVGPEIRKVHPNARVYKSKRGLKIHFGSPVNDTDVTVDLIVALERRSARGLWIPNLKTDEWEPSDPIGHADLLNAAPDALRRMRRKVIRLVKAWNAQATTPGFSSHNLSVWGYEFVADGTGLVKNVHSVLSQAAQRIADGEPTADPQGVSPDINPLVSDEVAERRLRIAAQKLQAAIDAPDDVDGVQQVLEHLFPKTIEQAAESFAAAPHARTFTTAQLGLAGPSQRIPSTRSWKQR
ncbi:hypothetical protein [Streptacidiphilus carbonis]|uniref:hypothetical protein n=1 Tax=Streptacidiphilus carbonis TaxID=105422 RepID=UPI0005A948A8|nr:hypothetical protein [Streptacidiphilus carbonis]